MIVFPMNTDATSSFDFDRMKRVIATSTTELTITAQSLVFYDRPSSKLVLEWDTDLFDRFARSAANREINKLHGRMRYAKAAQARRNELLIMGLSNQVRESMR